MLNPRQIVSFAFVSSTLAYAQIPMTSSPGGAIRLFNTDLAVLEMQEPRNDLPCTVTPMKALLGFDLRFHSGYEVAIPLKELAGSENLLTVLFRVTPQQGNREPLYFTQKYKVPAIEEEAKGDAYLQGSFDIGEGKYHVDWLIRDRTERVCSSYWDTEAELSTRDKQMQLVIGPGEVQASAHEQFRDEPPIERAAGASPLNVKVLINFAPQNSRSATLQPLDTSALVSILRSISREPRIGKFSLVAFNLHEQRVVYRQDGADKINFPKLGEALEGLNLGTIDLKRLAEKHGEAEFLTELIRTEMGTADAQPDALIFAGPKTLVEENLQQEALKQVGEVEFPVFYMNYNLHPQTTPWRDAIGNAVRFFKGYEYTISRPRDLWFAITEMVSRIVKYKHGRASTASSE
jgi:hypothetical protein